MSLCQRGRREDGGSEKSRAEWTTGHIPKQTYTVRNPMEMTNLAIKSVSVDMTDQLLTPSELYVTSADLVSWL